MKKYWMRQVVWLVVSIVLVVGVTSVYVLTPRKAEVINKIKAKNAYAPTFLEEISAANSSMALELQIELSKCETDEQCGVVYKRWNTRRKRIVEDIYKQHDKVLPSWGD